MRYLDVLLRSKQMHITVPMRVEGLEANAIKIVGPRLDGLVGAALEEGRSEETTTIKRINRLVVRTINGLDWNQFAQSVFVKNAPKNIKGKSSKNN